MANGFSSYVNEQYKKTKKPKIYKTTGSQYDKGDLKEQAEIRSQLANDIAYWEQKRGVKSDRQKDHVAVAENYYKKQAVQEDRNKAGQKRMSENKGKGKYSQEDRLQEYKDNRDNDRKESSKEYEKSIGKWSTADFKKQNNYGVKGLVESDVRFRSYMDKQKGKKNTIAQQLVPEFNVKKEEKKPFDFLLKPLAKDDTSKGEFDTEKHKDVFEKRFGTGSYNLGILNAREIGKAKANASVAETVFKESQSEAKKGQKEIQKKKAEEDEINKILEEAKGSKGSNKKKEEKSFLDKIFDFNKDKKKPSKPADLNLSIRDGGMNKTKGKFTDSLDVFSNLKKSDEPTKLDRFNRGLSQLTNSATLGLPKEIAKKLSKEFDNKTIDDYYEKTYGEKGANWTDNANSLAGYLVPGVGTANAVRGTTQGTKSLNTLLGKNLTKKSTKQIAKETSKEGALIGGLMGSTEVGIRETINPEDTNWKQNASQIALETAGGAVLDPLLTLAKPVFKATAEGAAKKALSSSQKSFTDLAPMMKNLPKESKAKLLAELAPKAKAEMKTLNLDLLSPGSKQSAATTTGQRYNTDILMKSYKGQDVSSNISAIPEGVAPKKVVDSPTSGDITSFRGKVNRAPAKEKDGLLKDLRTQFVDDVAPLERLEKKITGKLNSAEDSVYKQARLFKGSPEKAHLIVKEELYPVLKELQDNGMNYKDLGDYALAVHAKDVNGKGINSGFTNAEIDDVLTKLGSEPMETARLKLLGVNNKVLDMLLQGGIIDNAQVAAMREKYPNYVSLFRSFDDDKVEFVGGLGKALANATSPIKKLVGSSREVIDPMESVIKNIFKATNAVDRNKVGTQIANLAKKDTKGDFIRQLADDEVVGRSNVVSVLDNGKQVKYEVPPEVYRTLTNMDKESSNTLINILQKPASLLRAGATLTPEFSLRNPLRDVPNAFVVSESGFNPLVDFPIGLWQSVLKGRTIKIGGKEFTTPGELYKQFVKENGGYGNIISMDRKLHQETLKKALTDVNTNYIDVLNPKTYTALMKKLSNPINTLRTIADVTETATKVGEFRAARRSGASLEEAAYRARDIMDFARAGISVREANKVVAFLNANIQGKSKLWRAFKENPTGVTGRAVSAVTIPTIGVIVAQNTYANDKQKEIINDAPRWMKDTFWLVPVPGSNQIARIPKPFDLAFAFSNTMERAVEYIHQNDKEAFDGWVKQAFSQASVPVMLTGIAPIIEGMADYSFFRQAPIIPLRDKGLEYPDQYDVNTTETAKFIGKQVNKFTGGVGAFKNFGSPRVVDNTIRGFTGGLGTYATSAIDIFAKGGEGEPVRPSKSVDQMPLARAFLVNQSGSGESLEKLYNLREKLTKARGSAKQRQEPFMDEAKYQAVNDITKDIGELNKQIRFVENNLEMSAEDKKIVLDELISRRNKTSRQGMEKIKSME